MGILDALLGKKDVGNELVNSPPFNLKLRFRPVRLAAHKNESVDLLIDLKNLRQEALLSSVVIRVKKGLGTDPTGINQIRELRLGWLTPNQAKELCVEVYGNSTTDGGEYPIEVVAYAHYRDYGHVLNSIVKKVSLRVEE